MMRSKARTFTVYIDTEGPTYPPWIPGPLGKRAHSAGRILRAPVGLALLGLPDWMRPRLHLPVDSLIEGALGKVDFREESMLVKSLQERKNERGCRAAQRPAFNRKSALPRDCGFAATPHFLLEGVCPLSSRAHFAASETHRLLGLQ